jgi:hypothetical protein
MTKRKEHHIDLSAIWDKCDLALEAEFGNSSKEISYIANTTGREFLHQISPENFPDTIWTEPFAEARDWRAAIVRMTANEESTEDIVMGITKRALIRGLRVMICDNTDGHFEPARLGTLEEMLALIRPQGTA